MEENDQPYNIFRDQKFWDALGGTEEDDALADFRETDAGAPYMWMLGRIILDFNYAEHQLKALFWGYFSDSFEAGHALTTALGSTTVTAILRDAVKRSGEPQEVLKRIDFAGQAFDICRANRNALAHSMTVERYDDDSSVWIRASRKLDYHQTQMKITLKDMFRVSREVAETARFILALQMRRNMLIRGSNVLPDLPDYYEKPTRLISKDINLANEAKKLGLHPSGE
ncbi:hypothetical protein FIU66_10325 [Paracoccus sp. AK26]|nr:hypothetical protein FIU66_10325 [Paracoccus sp. AK26]